MYFLIFNESLMSLRDTLSSCTSCSPVVMTKKPWRKLDFTAANAKLFTVDLTNTEAFSTYVFGDLLENSRYAGVGGYAEHRIIFATRRISTVLPERSVAFIWG